MKRILIILAFLSLSLSTTVSAESDPKTKRDTAWYHSDLLKCEKDSIIVSACMEDGVPSYVLIKIVDIGHDTVYALTSTNSVYLIPYKIKLPSQIVKKE